MQNMLNVQNMQNMLNFQNKENVQNVQNISSMQNMVKMQNISFPAFFSLNIFLLIPLRSSSHISKYQKVQSSMSPFNLADLLSPRIWSSFTLVFTLLTSILLLQRNCIVLGSP